MYGIKQVDGCIRLPHVGRASVRVTLPSRPLSQIPEHISNPPRPHPRRLRQGRRPDPGQALDQLVWRSTLRHWLQLRPGLSLEQ